MLLSWARNRISGPRCFPSGSRLGPYWERRRDASAVSNPVAGSVRSRPTTSSAGTACQAMVSESGLPPTASDIPVLPRFFSPTSPALCDKLHAFERSQIIVGIVHYAVGQLCRLLRHFFVGNEAEQMADAI